MLATLMALSFTAAAIAEPEPLLPVPSHRQRLWQELEYYGFVHFGPNTFSGNEWGKGTEDPNSFNPTEFDARQWVRAFKDAGMTGVILTAKHHDGFCLWPSKYSTHTVAQSRWRNGKGDVVGDLAKACREAGLKFGVYLSPWDRNHPTYGTDEYNEVFKKTLAEVLTQYGEIFEVWFDGANGEGPNGRRQVYDWPGFIETVRRHQPNAVIFSDAGPDIRWIGNERGYSAPTNWALLRRDEVYPGWPRYAELTEGHADGTHWVPGEADVSIRPGWFWRASENGRVKTGRELLDIYFGSVGQNASLLLNVPPDTRGRIHQNDIRALNDFRRAREAIFTVDHALGRPVEASVNRGLGFEGKGVADRDAKTFWAAPDGVVSASLTVTLARTTSVGAVRLAEETRLGQRVRRFSIEGRRDGAWVPLFEGTTIGMHRIVRFPSQRVDAVRVNILDARACPTLNQISVYSIPPEVRMTAGATAFVERTRVVLEADDPEAAIHYTMDGSTPTRRSPRYTGPFEVDRTARLTAKAYSGRVGSIWPLTVELKRYAGQDLMAPVDAPAQAGLQTAYYEGGWQSLVDMPGRTPVSNFVAEAIDLSGRKRDEHFALRFEGFWRAPADGIYTFWLASDDGSRLLLGGKTVIDHDGLHGMDEKSAIVGLRAGWHPIVVEYFNAAGGRGLRLEVTGPDGKRVPVQGFRHR